MKAIKLVFGSLFLAALLLPASVWAHVSVKPEEVGIGTFQTFTVGVPTELESPTIKLRLVVPEGVENVRPNVKPGWDVRMGKTGEGEDARVTELIWSGGQIPPEQRDEFSFSAQVPAQATELVWKAYQTYSDGTEVAWADSPEQEDGKPYSQTQVVDDLAVEGADGNETAKSATDKIPLYASIAAVIMATIALIRKPTN